MCDAIRRGGTHSEKSHCPSAQLLCEATLALCQVKDLVNLCSTYLLSLTKARDLYLEKLTKFVSNKDSAT